MTHHEPREDPTVATPTVDAPTTETPPVPDPVARAVERIAVDHDLPILASVVRDDVARLGVDALPYPSRRLIEGATTAAADDPDGA